MVLVNFRSQYLNAYWVLSQLPLCSPISSEPAVQLGQVIIANSEEMPLPGDNRLLFHGLGFAAEKIGRRFRL